MKTLIALLLLSFVSGPVAAATKQGHALPASKITVPNGGDVDGLEIDQDDTGQNAVKISSGGVVLAFKTVAQFNALTPVTTGQLFMCSDCTRSTLCVSSGVLTGAWVVAVATGTFAGSSWSGLQHCQ